VTDLVARHRVACAGFSRVCALVAPDHWDRPTPCTDWDARALVEHVIGFHEFLLLRPFGVRANRPKTGPAARWEATATALFGLLDEPGALDRESELPGGGHSSPRTMLGALTTDVLIHTWDLARATGVEHVLDRDLATAAYDGLPPGTALPADMYAAPVAVADNADATARLVARCGRDPQWAPSAPAPGV
jgi:uncharacterized protein (TIGR03086 family)